MVKVRLKCTVFLLVHSHTPLRSLCTKVIKVSQLAARCQSSKLLHHSARWYLKPIHRISRPWLPLLGAVAVLLLICSLSHRNRKEERETDGKPGEWQARDTMLTAPFLLLLILSTSVSLLCSGRSLAVLGASESGGSQSIWQYCIQVVVNNGG